MIPYSCQSIEQDDIDAVVQVLKSDWLTQGPTVSRFEAAVLEQCENVHAVAVSNATAALHLACLALGLGPGDALWTSPITYVASANCARYCGAGVDFVDIDTDTFNLCPDALQQKLEQAAVADRLPRALVAVHMGGVPCDMDRIRALCNAHGVALIEDASHAIGSRYRGRPVGCAGSADVTVFSFHPVKNITTGEGGMAVCADPELADRIRLLHSQGITRQVDSDARDAGQPWYYEQLALGYNYRLTDIQAALGISQLGKLERFTAERNRRADWYREALADLPLRAQYCPGDCVSAYHLYIVCLDSGRTTVTRRALFNGLRERGIGVNVHYIPVHTQPYYRELGFRPEQFPRSIEYYDRCLSLPLFPTMTDDQQAAVRDALVELLC